MPRAPPIVPDPLEIPSSADVRSIGSPCEPDVLLSPCLLQSPPYCFFYFMFLFGPRRLASASALFLSFSLLLCFSFSFFAFSLLLQRLYAFALLSAPALHFKIVISSLCLKFWSGCLLGFGAISGSGFVLFLTCKVLKIHFFFFRCLYPMPSGIPRFTTIPFGLEVDQDMLAMEVPVAPRLISVLFH